MSNFDFTLPDVGEGIAEAEIIEWLVAVGDTVTVDQVVAVIETDKSQIEMPTPVAGIVTALNGKPGDVIKVGDVLITIAPNEGAVPVAAPTQTHTSTSIAAATTTTNVAPSTVPVNNSVGCALASPSTRRVAAQCGIDINAVAGTGPHGRVTEADVRGHNNVPTSGPASVVSKAIAPTLAQDGVTIVPLIGLRRQIAQSMTQALAIPHILEFKEIDATALLAAREQVNSAGHKLSVTPFLMKAVINALLLHPTFNARFNSEANEVAQFDAVHLGIATATPDGLIVPVLHNAQGRDVVDLGAQLDELAELAKTRKASPEQLTGGTFSLTNFGSFGTWLGTPVIRPPEVGIAGFGRIADKVIVVDGQPAVRKILPIVVAADHRVNDGAHLGAFAAEIAQQLLNPEGLV
jgi:pyruvate/2-oxoglutarate dehydrogenase complex dihydrolipoamide acyltransferase (E2) component